MAARTSVGKTSFALNVARHLAIEELVPVLFVSLEQSADDLYERLLCCQARVNSHRLRQAQLTGQEADRVWEAMRQCEGCPLFIDEQSAQDMLRIGTVARQHHWRHGVRVVIVDYLQMVVPEDQKESRQGQVAAITRRLKGLARLLNIPIVALAQLNRGLEDRSDRKPRLSDLRESGAIEQEADVVLLLHRPDESQDVVCLDVARQRNGPTGEIPLYFRQPSMRFENFSSFASAGPDIC